MHRITLVLLSLLVLVLVVSPAMAAKKEKSAESEEDKGPLFDTVDTLTACIEICTAMLPQIKINKSKMHQSASGGYLNATDLADYLTTRGVAFREAHRLTGEAVKFALGRKKELHELSLDQLQSFCPLIKDDIFSYLTTAEMIKRRASYGGTAAKMVAKAIADAGKWLDDKLKHLSEQCKYANVK